MGDQMDEEQSNEFDQLMLALGSVVVMWGMVEDMVRHVLRDVVLEDAKDPEVEQIVLSETSFRSQLDILRKVAHVRWPNSDWFNKVDVLIRQLSGPIHAKRNRLIHDLWENNEEGQIIKYVRGKDETAVQKKSGEWQLKLTGEKAVPVAEVEAFFEEAADACEALLALKSEYVEWRIKAKTDAIMGNLVRQLTNKIGDKVLARPLDADPMGEGKPE